MNRSSDDLDDVTLPQRTRRAEVYADTRSDARGSSRAGGGEDLRDEMAAEDREFTLSTGTVLGLFFGLALVCAVFFGFGYSMGKKSAAAAVPVADTAAGGDTAETAAGDGSTTIKPSAGSPAVQAIPGYQSQGSAEPAARLAPPATVKPLPTGAGTTVTVPIGNPTPAASGTAAVAVARPRQAPVDPDSQVVGVPSTPARRPAVVAAATPVVAPVQTMNAGTPIPTGGSTYVQIAAVSHKEDADVLITALKRRGYSVFTRPGDTDKLIHVQVGPFPTKKDAEAMRQKLLGDGYNAILK